MQRRTDRLAIEFQSSSPSGTGPPADHLGRSSSGAQLDGASGWHAFQSSRHNDRNRIAPQIWLGDEANQRGARISRSDHWIQHHGQPASIGFRAGPDLIGNGRIEGDRVISDRIRRDRHDRIHQQLQTRKLRWLHTHEQGGKRFGRGIGQDHPNPQSALPVRVRHGKRECLYWQFPEGIHPTPGGDVAQVETHHGPDRVIADRTDHQRSQAWQGGIALRGQILHGAGRGTKRGFCARRDGFSLRVEECTACVVAGI